MSARRADTETLLKPPSVMASLIFAVVLLVVLANLPLLYMLFFGHPPQLIGRMWGWAPNQFLFPVLFYPFAALSTFLALRRFNDLAAGGLPVAEWIRYTLRSWPAYALLGIAITSVVAFIVYLGSGLSIDKLQTPYAERAVHHIDDFKHYLEGASDDKSMDELRTGLIVQAQDIIEVSDPPVYTPGEQVDEWLSQLDYAEYLQVVHSPRLQRELGLISPTLHVLAGVQLISIISVAALCAFTTILCIAAEQELMRHGHPESLQGVIQLLQISVLFFAAFALCYGQHRREVEWLTGAGGQTILQDVFVGVVALVLLSWLAYISPSGQMPLGDVLRFLPALVFGVSAASPLLKADVFKRLIGSETTFGIQALLILLAGVAGAAWLAVLLQEK